MRLTVKGVSKERGIFCRKVEYGSMMSILTKIVEISICTIEIVLEESNV